MAALANQNTQSHHPATYNLSSSAATLISAARSGRTLRCQVIGTGTAILGSGTGEPNPVTGGFGMTLVNPTTFEDSTSTADWWACSSTGSVQLNVDEIY